MAKLSLEGLILPLGYLGLSVALGPFLKPSSKHLQGEKAIYKVKNIKKKKKGM